MMNLKDAAVVDFHFSPGEKRPFVRAMVLLTYQRIEKPQTAWAGLTEEEAEAIFNVARLVEQRLRAGKPPAPKSAKKPRIGLMPVPEDQD